VSIHKSTILELGRRKKNTTLVITWGKFQPSPPDIEHYLITVNF